MANGQGGLATVEMPAKTRAGVQFNDSTKGGHDQRENRKAQITRVIASAADEAGVRSHDPAWRIRMLFETDVVPHSCVPCRFDGARNGHAVVFVDELEDTIEVPLA